VNLLINAVEAMPSGGDLTVDARIVPTQSLQDPSGAGSHHDDCIQGRQVQVRICDTGRGIAPEILPRLFEPFVTNKERGTGLGLAISRRVAAEHSGSIVARNLSSAGAEFLLTIPSAPVESATELLSASM
jgi:signal transduction histidine kinase